MMIRLPAAIAAFTLAACAASSEGASAPNAQAATQFDTAEAQRRFDAMAENFPALNATVMVGDEIVWEAEGGVARDDRDSVDTDYNIYSISKMLTGLAFARLESEGAVDLDQSVRRIEQRLPAFYEEVTLRHLLGHRAGVRHYLSDEDWIAFNDMRCDKPQDALGHFVEDPLDFEPGQDFSYSTFGFTLASHLLVQVTGEATYDDAMRAVWGERFVAKTDSEGANKAVNYMGEAGAFEEIDLSAECKFGGGGLIASAGDLAAMGSALANGDIVPTGFALENFTPGKTANGADTNYVYGMGVGLAESIDVHYAAHSGGSPGGRGFLMVFLEPNVTVALTSNFDGPHHADLATALARIFSGFPAEAEESGE